MALQDIINPHFQRTEVRRYNMYRGYASATLPASTDVEVIHPLRLFTGYFHTQNVFSEKLKVSMTHTITHIEIPAPDLTKAMSFYAKIFKWEVQMLTPDKYAFFRILETSGGGFDASLKPAPAGTGPQLTIDVEDIDETLRQIHAEGGTIILPKTEIGDGHGNYAVFLDPNGNSLQLHSRE